MFKSLKTNILLILITGIFTIRAGAQTADSVVINYYDTVAVENQARDSLKQQPVQVKDSKRVVAVLLCITLGPFGMHRLYLGTEPQVAAAYTVTLGGGFGFVTVIDLLHLVFSKDISRFRNNPHFIMWRKP